MKLDIFKMSIYENLKIVFSKYVYLVTILGSTLEIWQNYSNFLHFHRKLIAVGIAYVSIQRLTKHLPRIWHTSFYQYSLYIYRILTFKFHSYSLLLCPFHARINKTTFKVLSNCSHSRCNYFMLSNMSLKSHLIKNSGNW